MDNFEYSTRMRLLEDNFEIDLTELSNQKFTQLKKIRLMIENNLALALHFYSKSKYWKRIYWIAGIVNVLLVATNALINAFIKDEIDQSVPNYNVIFGILIAMILGIITFLNPSERHKHFELAGDRYIQVSDDIFNEIFYSNDEIEKMDLGKIIELNNKTLAFYRELYSELTFDQLQKIKNTNLFMKENKINRLKFIDD